MTHDRPETVLANRLDPGTRREPCVAYPWLLAAAGFSLFLALIALPKSRTAAGILAVFCVGFLRFAFGTREVPIVPESMPGGWEGYQFAVRLLAASLDPLEQAHAFVGWLYGTARRVTVLLHDKLSKMHVHVLGPTGFAKTYKFAVPFCCQLLTRASVSLVYMDLKGAPKWIGNAAFWILAGLARLRRIPVYYFSLIPDEASHLLAGLRDPAFVEARPRIQARVLAESFAVEHGEEYGKGYHGGTGAKILRRGLARLKRMKVRASFARLAAFLAGCNPKTDLGMLTRDYERGSAAVNAIEELADYRRLNTTGEEPIAPSLFKHEITADKVIGKPGLFYFKLPALYDAVAARYIARFFIRLLLERVLVWNGPRVDHVYVCIDECQEVLQRSLLTPIAQAREFGVSFILVHQNVSDLKRDGHDFTDLVMNNTAVRVILASKDDDGRRRVMNSSGTVVLDLPASSQTVTSGPSGEGVGQTTGVHGVRVPAIDENALKRINADPELAILEAGPYSGYTRLAGPTVIEIPFAMSEEEFNDYRNCPWPEPNGVSTVLDSDIPEDPQPPPPPPDAGPDEPPPDVPKGGGRKRKTKPIDPERRRRGDELRAQLLGMRGGNEPS